MNQSETPNFAVSRLGPAVIPSPLKLSTDLGDRIADFVPEDASILFDDRPPVDTSPGSQIELAGPRPNIYFDPKKVRAAVVTCGGLCPGINNVVRSIVRELVHHYGVTEIWGLQYGYWGMVPENRDSAVKLDPETVENIHHQGGSFLGSSRGPQKLESMLEFLASKGINVLFTVGGDGTQRGALAISEAARRRNYTLSVVGIPKTIDNDLAYTERTFGYETACAAARDILFAAHAEAKGARYGVSVVKLMGRESGFIAATAALGSGVTDFVLVPEVPFDLEGEKGLLTALEQKLHKYLHALVVVAEGAGQDLLLDPESKNQRDASGNLKLGDIGSFLAEKIRSCLRRKGIPGVVKYIVPSYIIRSAPANAGDHVFCTNLAQNAVHAAMSGRTALVIGLWHGSFVHIPMETAVSHRKKINPDGTKWLAVVEATGQPAVMRNRG